MSDATVAIRPATEQDASGVLAIYAPIIRDTVISFEFVVPDEAEIRRRIRSVIEFHPWLVAVSHGGGVLGYAYASRHRERAAYQWAVDTAIYVHSRARRVGVARSLYRALLEGVRLQGFYQAYAGITLPNTASVALHESFGFERVGLYPRIGYKLGAWHDVGWWGLSLRPRDERPAPPISFAEVCGRREWLAFAEECTAGVRVAL